jgi:hypothetical protein
MNHSSPYTHAVHFSFSTFELLLSMAEDIAIADRIRVRDGDDSGNRTSLAAVAAELGIDLDSL